MLFLMCEPLHVAVKMYIYYSFFYICCFITAEVCNLRNMHCGTLTSAFRSRP